jgi:membrane protein
VTAPENSKIIYEPGGTEVNTSAGTGRRYRKPFLHFKWRDFFALLGDAFSEWNRQNAQRLGAAVAFYSLLSLAPLLLLAVSIVSLVFGHSAAEAHVANQAAALMGPTAAKVVTGFLSSPGTKSHGILGAVFGIFTLLFSASGVMVELRDDLNNIWEIPVPNVSGMKMIMLFLKERLFSFAMVLSIGFLLIVSLAVSTWITELSSGTKMISGWEAALFHVISTLVSIIIIAVLFGAVYKVVPELPIEWRDVMMGGLFTSVLFALGKLILGIYLGRASYSSMYGAAASVIVLIAWIYYSAQIFFLGAEFTKVFARKYGSKPKDKPAQMISTPGSQPHPNAHVVHKST